jgi:hypothetical protein
MMMGKYVKGCDCGLIAVLYRYMPVETEENYEKP